MDAGWVVATVVVLLVIGGWGSYELWKHWHSKRDDMSEAWAMNARRLQAEEERVGVLRKPDGLKQFISPGMPQNVTPQYVTVVTQP